jgi:hypothetical protein
MKTKASSIGLAKMKKHLTVLIMFFTSCFVMAEQIDIGIFETDGQGNIEVRIRPDFLIPGDQTISSILYTIRWEASDSLSMANIEFIFPFFVQQQGVPELYNGYYYQVWAAIPMVPVGTAIEPGEERVISSFTISGANCHYVELIDDDWTSINNGGPYIAVMGTAKTGDIYEAYAPDYRVFCPDEPVVVCCNDEAFILDMATPTGGAYTGPLVTFDGENYIFTPDCDMPGAHSITYTGEQGCTSCSFTITVHALTPVSCPDNHEVCYSELPLDLTTLGASPPGGIFSGDGVTGNNFIADAGTTNTIVYTFTDENACSNSCSFTIQVNSAPEISCTQSISGISNESGACSAIVEYDVITAGIPAPQISYELNGATSGGGSGSGSGQTFNVGVTQVTITAENICAIVSCVFSITVTDDEDPVISCPVSPQERMIVEPENTYTTAGDEFDPVSVSDNCNGDILLTNNLNGQNTLSGHVFMPGTTTVEWTATDPYNNSSSCTFDVIITQSVGVSSLEHSSVTLYARGNKLHVQNPHGKALSIMMFDMAGRLIETFAATGTIMHTLHLDQGFYIVRMIDGDGQKAIKIIIH